MSSRSLLLPIRSFFCSLVGLFCVYIRFFLTLVHTRYLRGVLADQLGLQRMYGVFAYTTAPCAILLFWFWMRFR